MIDFRLKVIGIDRSWVTATSSFTTYSKYPLYDKQNICSYRTYLLITQYLCMIHRLLLWTCCREYTSINFLFKYHTVGIDPKSNSKSWKEAKAIPRTHKYMTDHFPGCVEALNYTVVVLSWFDWPLKVKEQLVIEVSTIW